MPDIIIPLEVIEERNRLKAELQKGVKHIDPKISNALDEEVFRYATEEAPRINAMLIGKTSRRP